MIPELTDIRRQFGIETSAFVADNARKTPLCWLNPRRFSGSHSVRMAPISGHPRDLTDEQWPAVGPSCRSGQTVEDAYALAKAARALTFQKAGQATRRRVRSVTPSGAMGRFTLGLQA